MEWTVPGMTTFVIFLLPLKALPLILITIYLLASTAIHGWISTSPDASGDPALDSSPSLTSANKPLSTPYIYTTLS